MFDKRKHRAAETDWEGIPLPTIDVATRKEAYNSIPDSQWRDFADKALVAIALGPARIIAASNDHDEIKTLAEREGVPYFVTPSKFYQKPRAGGSRKSVA